MGYQEREPIEAVISELKPRMKSVNISFKVIEKGEVRDVTSRSDGEQHRVCDTIVGDSSGKVTVPLWDAAIDEIEAEKTYRLENGYTTLFQGHLRLNIGRYGTLKPAEEEIAEKNQTAYDLYETVWMNTVNRTDVPSGGWRYSCRGRDHRRR